MNLVLTTLVPVFGIMLAGAVSKKLNLLGSDANKILSRFVLVIALPSIFFIVLAETKIEVLLNKPFIFAMLIIFSGIYLIVIFYYRFRRKEHCHICFIRSLCVISPNSSFMGIPIILSILGTAALVPLAIVNLFMVIFFCLTVILLDITRRDHIPEENMLFELIGKLKQPILLSLILGVLASAIGLHIPKPVSAIFHTLGMTSGPCAMFVIGEKLTNLKITTSLRKLTSFCAIKLILIPVVTLIFMLMLNMDPLWAATGYILMAMPCANSTYMLALEKNLCVNETADVITYSTILSIFTLSALVLTLSYIWPNLTFLTTT